MRGTSYTRLQKFFRGGFTDHQSVNATVTEIKSACDELERAVRKRKIWVTSRRLLSLAQIVLGAPLTPLSPWPSDWWPSALGSSPPPKCSRTQKKPELKAPDLAMLLDVRHELDLGT